MMHRLPAILAIVLVISGGLPTANAQDKENTEALRIEIKDGRVLVNGVDAGAANSDRIQITHEDGREVFVRLDKSRGTVWVGDEAGNDPHLGLRSPGSRSFFRFRNEDGDIDSEWVADPQEMADRIRTFSLRSRPDRPFLEPELREFLVRPESGMTLFGEDGPSELFRMMPNSEVMKMEREINELARQVRRATGSEREELEARLDTLLNDAFDLKLQAEREQAEQLQGRIDRLRERLSERSESRAKIIARKKTSLLGERDLLDW